MNYANSYLKHALIYLILGMILGLYMASTLNYTHKVTHVHLLMLGSLIPFSYACIHKLFLAELKQSALAKWQYVCHQLGTLLLIIGFVIIFGGYAHPAIGGITSGIGGLLVIVATAIMYWLIKRYQG